MKKIPALAMIGLMIIFLCPVSARPASIDDYVVYGDLYPSSFAGPIIDLAVTYDDRFVIILLEDSVRFLDTWDFTVLGGTTAVAQLAAGDNALSLTVSPYGDYAYVGLTSGDMAIVNLAPLSSRVPGGDLSSAPIVNTVDTAAFDPINVIDALPDPGIGGDVFLLMGTSVSLYQGRVQNGNTLPGSNAVLSTGPPVALSHGGDYGFNLWDAPGFVLDAISCAGGSCIYIDTSTLNLTGDFYGLVTEPADAAYSVALEATGLQLIDTGLSVPMELKDTSPGTFAGHDIALLANPVGLGDLVFTASGETITITEIDGASVLFSGSYAEISELGAVFDTVVASGGTDGYVYLASGASVNAVTANPWIENLTAPPTMAPDSSGGDTYQVTDSFQVSFNVRSALANVNYRIYKSRSFGTWGLALVIGPPINTGAGVETVTIDADRLEECDNVLTVIAEDSNGREGRLAVAVTRDMVPGPQGFNLDFGDRMLIFEFTANPLCDLSGFEVFYGTDPNISDYTGLLNGSSLFKPYTAAIGDKINDSITGLTNGTRYWVWVVIVDESGKKHIGTPQSAIPQPTATLTEMTGEDGGVNCLPAVSGRMRGDPGSAAWFLAPFLVAGAYRAARRWRR